MSTPVMGVVTSKYDLSCGRNGIVVMAERKSSVHAILDGVVVFPVIALIISMLCRFSMLTI